MSLRWTLLFTSVMFMNLQKYIIFQKMALCLSLKQRNQAFVWSSHSWIHIVPNWPSGRSVIALAISKLVTISQKDRDVVAKIVQATPQKWCRHWPKWSKSLKHLLQTRPAHGTMLFLSITDRSTEWGSQGKPRPHSSRTYNLLLWMLES